MEREYIIISLKHSRDRFCYWMPNDSGYTENPFQAGRYPESIVRNRPDYYNNGTSTLAVPAESMEWLAPAITRTSATIKQLRNLANA